MAIDERALEESASHVALQRLLSAYTDVASRRAWSELPALFLPDAKLDVTPLRRDRLEVVGPEAIARFIDAATERFAFFQFVLLNSRLEIRLDEDSARGRNFICEYRREGSPNGDEPGRWTQVFGVYHDRYRRVDGRWWFEHRVFDPLAARGNDDLLFEVPARLARLMSEPL